MSISTAILEVSAGSFSRHGQFLSPIYTALRFSTGAASMFSTEHFAHRLQWWHLLGAQPPLFRNRGTTSLSVRCSLGAPATTARFLPARWCIVWCCWWHAASMRWWNVTTAGILLSPIHCHPMPLQHIRQRTLRYVQGNQAFPTFCWGVAVDSLYWSPATHFHAN